MKQIKLAILLSISLISHFSAHAEEVIFFKKYGEHNVDFSEQVKQTPDGNLLILSSIRRPNSLGQIIRDLYLVKTDLEGDTIWTKYAGRDERSELGRDLEILNDGNFLIAGFSAYNMGNTVKGFLMQFDSSGNMLWEKYYGNETDMWSFTSMKVMEDGYVMAGTQENMLTGAADALVLKTTLAGDSVWSTIVGGEEYDDAWDVELAPDGGYVFTGGTYSFADGSLDDAWIVKLDTEGTYQWRKTYGVADRIDWAWAFVPSKDSDGNTDGYVFTGIKDAGEEGTIEGLYGDFHFVKVDTAGAVVWDKSIVGTGGAMRREGTDIIATSDGGYAMCGYGIATLPSGGPVNRLYFVKADENGDVEYAFYANDISDRMLPRALTQTTDGNFYVTGMASNESSPEARIFLVKIGSDTTTSILLPGRSTSLISMYPNPALNNITIDQHRETIISSVNILSIDGKLLQAIEVRGNGNITVPVSQYSGMSILVDVHCMDGSRHIQKVVVR